MALLEALIGLLGLVAAWLLGTMLLVGILRLLGTAYILVDDAVWALRLRRRRRRRRYG